MMMRCCRSLGPWTASVVQGKPGGLSWLAQVLAFTCRNALDMDMGSLGQEGAFAFDARESLVAQGPSHFLVPLGSVHR